MRVCLICVEIFAWGKYGGFGRATRVIGGELAKRGIKVFAVVPRRQGQKEIEELDGITVLGFPSRKPWLARNCFRICDADIYHSQEPSFLTHMAMKAMPGKKHVITLRDPREWFDWWIEFLQPSRSKFQVLSNFFFEDFLSRKAVKSADGVFCTAENLLSKAVRKYGLKKEPGVLATPVFIPEKVEKASSPTVCFIGRWDRRKQPEIFFELAKAHPGVNFIAVGKSRDKKRNLLLEKRYSSVPNLVLKGFVDQFASDGLFDLLSRAWILVNTSSREGLPTSFLEALAHRCSLLSMVNPGGVAEQFGYHVKDGDFSRGLQWLLDKDRWKERGEKGFEYVKQRHDLGKVIYDHEFQYKQVLGA
jgi:glycosyltransferase involved in cell wall biosynthesis